MPPNLTITDETVKSTNITSGYDENFPIMQQHVLEYALLWTEQRPTHAYSETLNTFYENGLVHQSSCIAIKYCNSP